MSANRYLEKDELTMYLNKNISREEEREEGEIDDSEDERNENSETTKLKLQKSRKRKWNYYLTKAKGENKECYKRNKTENGTGPGDEEVELSDNGDYFQSNSNKWKPSGTDRIIQNKNKNASAELRKIHTNETRNNIRVPDVPNDARITPIIRVADIGKEPKIRVASVAKLTNSVANETSANIVEDAQTTTIRKESKSEYCASLFRVEVCRVEGCAASHILDPLTGRDYLDMVAQTCGDGERGDKMLRFWRFHATRSAGTGAAILSRLSEMCSNGRLNVGFKGYAEMVSWVQNFPQYYTIQNQNSFVVMKELLEGASKVAQREGCKGTETSVIINWAWEKIYLASTSNGRVLEQEVLLNICGLLKSRGLFCLLTELLFISSMTPTLFVPMEMFIFLLSQLPDTFSFGFNVFNCQCGNDHTSESCISICKIFVRLSFIDLSNLNNNIKNFPSKLEILVRISKNDMDEEDFGRFVRRIRDLDPGIPLPSVAERSNAMKKEIRKKIGERKWKEIVRKLTDTDNSDMEQMVEYVEEVYGVMRDLPGHNAAIIVFENINKEIEQLPSTELQKQLIVQLGLSMMLCFVDCGHIRETVRILHILIRSRVDLSRLKPLIVFDLEGFVENDSGLSIPVFLIDLCLEVDNVELASFLLSQWKYLTLHPNIHNFNLRNKMFEKFLQKIVTSVKFHPLKIYITCLRIFDIFCEDAASGWPRQKKETMTGYGQSIIVNLLNGGMAGLELWGAAITANKCLYVVVGNIARGVVVRLMQANMVKEARTVYNWPGVPYHPQIPDLDKMPTIQNIKSFYRSEELEVLFIDYFSKLKTSGYSGGKGVFLQILECEPPSTRVHCLEQWELSKTECLARIRRVLANMKPPLSVREGVLLPFIPPQLMLDHISQNIRKEY